MRKILIFALIALTSLSSCCNKCGEEREWKAKHVVLIGVDGWASWCVRQAENIPNIRSLMENGSYTLKKRSVMPSASAINWASMFNGAPTEMHCMDKWNSKTPTLPAAYVNSHGVYPTVYSVLKEQYPEAKTGCTFDWDGIRYVIDTLAVDFYQYIPDGEQNFGKDVDIAMEFIKKEKPALMTIYFGGLDDRGGHSKGWGSPEYYKIMSEELDVQVGRIIQGLKDAGIYDDTIIMMAADHGGRGTDHGGFTLEELETPFIVCGKGVKKGYEFTETMMQYDTAATIAYVFGLNTPQAWRGVPMAQVFE